ncbi:Putative sporulation transcription regulator WhiA [Aedoeadaptatus ivorii]|uniref:Probable cell division protein WhiA n=1 Tax=Aedoeadaptatus ivorii TaxID=54006 RepID=A0A448V302_9FIRM|nr:DNA-binding protein WhiA [Peptoniphilus ivorii]VEJ36186.1 Putative sporulation transcription regulator WhiA [Peptoniphilus ivorii]
MSFSKDVKNELARVPMHDMEIVEAELAAYIRTCGVISLTKDLNIGLSFVTENAPVARRIVSVLKRVTDSGVEVMQSKNLQLKRNKHYKIRVEDLDSVQALLMDSDFLRQDNVFQMNYTLDAKFLRSADAIRAYIRGCFLGAGSITAPTKRYHLEFITHDRTHGADLCKWLNRVQLGAKGIYRKDDYIVYIKEAEKISDLLAFMGASRSVLEFESARVVKDVRNSVNRLVNCETANLTKTVDASARQVEDIELIERIYGMDRLKEDVRRVAELRLSHPQASLKELGAMMQPAMSRSGVNHRFKKIRALAEKLRGVSSERV